MLAKAKKQAKRSHCINNTKQIGLGFKMYVGDYDDKYPVHTDWVDFGGATGNFYSLPQQVYGTIPAANRPLNPYVGDTKSFRCPSDGGDAYQMVQNTFEAYGTSYSVQWAHNRYQTLHVTCTNKPSRDTDFAASPATKLIFGDFIWHRDRSVLLHSSGNREWHNYLGERRVNIFFADGHSEFFRFPPLYDAGATGPPDPANGWW